MYLNNFFNENPFVGILISFSLVIVFLIAIPLLYELIRKKILNRKKVDVFEKDKDKNESRLYEIIFSKDGISLKELEDYFTISLEDLNKYLDDLIDKNIIRKEDEKYYIKK